MVRALVDLAKIKPLFVPSRHVDAVRIGGLATFADELADDFAIGRAIRATGYRLAIPRFAVGHVCFERELRSFWDRQMRSARTIRSIDPIGYIGTIFMHPFVLALMAAIACRSPP